MIDYANPEFSNVSSWYVLYNDIALQDSDEFEAPLRFTQTCAFQYQTFHIRPFRS